MSRGGMYKGDSDRCGCSLRTQRRGIQSDCNRRNGYWKYHNQFSLRSILFEQDVETVNTMIYSVSRHFRYVFQDYNSQVLLEEELEEVSAYCNIYIIKNSVPLLLQQQVSEETKSYEVPILCIQTFCGKFH